MKQKSTKTLSNTLDFWFKRYIRLRDFRKGCISCGLFKNWGATWQAGHYYTKGSTWAALAFDEMNVNGQCAKCNLEEGSKQGYALGLVDRYGKDILQTLRIKLVASRGNRWDKFHYEILIRQYKEKVFDLEIEHGIEHHKSHGVSSKKVKSKKINWKKQYQERKKWKPIGSIQV